MPKLPITTYPDPILRKKTKKIKDHQAPEIKALILDMLETMESEGGLGLAAPQVGSSARLCVIKLDGKTHILLNPEITSKSWRKVVSEEGCLSFPGEFIPVKRSRSVKVRSDDRHGKKIEIAADGLFARALQHEIDHLDGILYIDRKGRLPIKK